MHDQPNHTTSPSDIIEYFDTHPDLTLRELSDMTGRSIAYLKGLLMPKQEPEL